MKLFKKVGAVFLALAMIAVMIPQIGNKVVKAADSPDTWTATQKSSVITSAGGIIEATAKATDKTVTDSDGTKYAYALKTGSSNYFKINVPANKYVKLTVVAVANKNDGSMSAIEIEGDTSTRKFIRAQSNDKPDTVTLNGHLAGGESGKTYNLKHVQNQLFIYKVVANVYENVEAIPTDPIVHKVSVTGTIKSSISLDKGKINFGLYEGTLNLKAGTTDEYTYELANVESDGGVYPVSIVADEVTKALKNIDPTSFGEKDNKVTVNYTEGSNNVEMDFTLKFTDLDGFTWDFSDKTKNWQASTYEAGRVETGNYKGLEITAPTVTENGKTYKGKFDVQPASGRIQINTATIVKIPVLGSGTVKCTFNGGTLNANTTLGVDTDVVTGSGSSITFNYKNAEYVELKIGNDNSGLYLQKIEVVLDPVIQLGASVRQKTEAWGDGIRFGGQLNLKKVGETYTSGTLIGLKATVGENEMILGNAGNTCVNVERTTFIEETSSSLVYAAALVKISDNQKDIQIVARPYVTTSDGTTYYGEQITTTYNEVVTKVTNVQ